MYVRVGLGQFSDAITKKTCSAQGFAALVLAVCLMTTGCSFLDRVFYQTPEEQCLSDKNATHDVQFKCLYGRFNSAAGSYAYHFERRPTSRRKYTDPKSDPEVCEAYGEFERAHKAFKEWLEKYPNYYLANQREREALNELLRRIDTRITNSHSQRANTELHNIGEEATVDELLEQLSKLLSLPQ